MPENNAGRPKEIHIAPISAIDRDALPLLTSMAFGETYVAEMFNMQNKAVAKSGVYSGFKVEPAGGLNLIVSSPSDSVSGAIVDCGKVPIQVFQQHDIPVVVETGGHVIVAIEAHFEHGVPTKQVSTDSLIDAAKIVTLINKPLSDNQLLLAEIDLTAGQTVISQSMIDTSNRILGGSDITGHNADPDAHPDMKNPTRSNMIRTKSNAIAYGRLNTITDNMHYTLLPEPDGTMFSLMVSPSVILDDDNKVIIAPPKGEPIYNENEDWKDLDISGTPFELKFLRENGKWVAFT